MAEPKTKKTAASVDAFLDAITDEQQRDDARRVAEMMRKITGEPPALWGSPGP